MTTPEPARIVQLSVPALARRAGRGRTLVVTVVVAGVGSLIAAATTSPYLAGAGLAMVGWASLAFNITNVSLRQRLTTSAFSTALTTCGRCGPLSQGNSRR